MNLITAAHERYSRVQTVQPALKVGQLSVRNTAGNNYAIKINIKYVYRKWLAVDGSGPGTPWLAVVNKFV